MYCCSGWKNRRCLCDSYSGRRERAPYKRADQRGCRFIYKTADPIYGGIKGAPKFPIGFQACFLLRVARALMIVALFSMSNAL